MLTRDVCYLQYKAFFLLFKAFLQWNAFVIHHPEDEKFDAVEKEMFSKRRIEFSSRVRNMFS